MTERNIVRVGAKSAAAHLIDMETAEIWFLTEENRSLRVQMSSRAIYGLAQRIMALANPPEH